jgi:repressor LexA
MATKPAKSTKKSPAPSKKISELPDGPADQNGLTPRQLKILQVIKTAVEDQGYPPSMREIGEKAGLSSTASVTYQLQILEEKGWIRRDASRGRAIEITLPGQDGEAAPQDKTRLIPLVGRIAAGNPILAEQEVEEVLPLPESIVGKGDLFLLQVKGDSMIDAAICDGDYVVIRAQKSAEKGEIVAAMIDGEATVKTWSKKEGHFWLLPANDNYAPIPADNAEILGKVTAVLRSI